MPVGARARVALKSCLSSEQAQLMWQRRGYTFARLPDSRLRESDGSSQWGVELVREPSHPLPGRVGGSIPSEVDANMGEVDPAEMPQPEQSRMTGQDAAVRGGDLSTSNLPAAQNSSLRTVGMSYHMRKGNNGRTIYIYENFNVEKDGETGHIAGYIVSYPSQRAEDAQRHLAQLRANRPPHGGSPPHGVGVKRTLSEASSTADKDCPASTSKPKQRKRRKRCTGEVEADEAILESSDGQIILSSLADIRNHEGTRRAWGLNTEQEGALFAKRLAVAAFKYLQMDHSAQKEHQGALLEKRRTPEYDNHPLAAGKEQHGVFPRKSLKKGIVLGDYKGVTCRASKVNEESPKWESDARNRYTMEMMCGSQKYTIDASDEAEKEASQDFLLAKYVNSGRHGDKQRSPNVKFVKVAALSKSTPAYCILLVASVDVTAVGQDQDPELLSDYAVEDST